MYHPAGCSATNARQPNSEACPRRYALCSWAARRNTNETDFVDRFLITRPLSHRLADLYSSGFALLLALVAASIDWDFTEQRRDDNQDQVVAHVISPL